MSQQINFYNTKLVKPKDWFSLTTVAIVYVAAAGAMMFYYQHLNEEAAAAEQSRNVAQLAFDKVQQELTNSMNASQNASIEKAQELILKKLQNKYALQEKIISAFEQTQSGTRHHVADYMLALSRQTVGNVWLTGFKLDPFKDYVSLKGRAYKSDLVPKYIQALSLDPVFKGQLFGGLNLKEVEQTDQRKQGDETQAGNATTNTTENTSVNTSSTSNDSNNPNVKSVTSTAGQSATTPQATTHAVSTQRASTTPVEHKAIDLIEFEIKGLDAKLKNASPAEEIIDEKVKEPENG